MPAATHAPALKPLVGGGGQVLTAGNSTVLRIPAGPPGRYRVAQLDDYSGLPRRDFPWRPPIRFSLRARISNAVETGTWGFGLWNAPFGVALNPRSKRLLLPTTPQASWFFWSSPASYLSFHDALPSSGGLAQTFRSAEGWSWLPPIALALVFRRATARKMLRGRIDEAAARLVADLTGWHSYEIRWMTKTVEYRLDDQVVLRSASPPRAPLGIVIWIDNQYAAFDPKGRIAWGFERTGEGCSLEISDLQVTTGD